MTQRHFVFRLISVRHGILHVFILAANTVLMANVEKEYSRNECKSISGPEVMKLFPCSTQFSMKF